ncbi:phage tail protein [Amycolatopsis sp. cmx-4-61]|uniref:phage tail protein n=1 Tax=Amycolatopsis sp. cmx-4-61 TaxID=2790937 RepID=UPI00397D7DCA
MSHRFVVHIDKSAFDLGSWSRVSGLGVTWAKTTYRPGENNNEFIIPGHRTYSNIKLERAACADSDTVKDWLTQTSKKRELLSGSIQMVDFVGMKVVEWELKQFFPVGWTIGEFNSGGAKPALETLDLAHSGFLNDEGSV